MRFNDLLHLLNQIRHGIPSFHHIPVELLHFSLDWIRAFCYSKNMI